MTNSINGSSSLLRFSGMATGLDVDSMVQQLMKAERVKLDKVKQSKQLLEWKRDDYRSIINTLRGFKDKYFDIISSSNMKSSSAYKVFSSTVAADNQALDTGAVTAVANSDATAGTHTIIVKQLATAQVRKSGSSITKDVAGDGAYTLNAGEKFNLTLDGVTKTITLTGTTVADLNIAIETAFGSNKVVVDDATIPGVLTFKAANPANGVNQISVSASTTDNALTNMGFGAGAILTNRLSGTDTLDAINSKLNASMTFTTLSDGTTQGISLNINGKLFEFSKDTTLNSMMSQINSDTTANVTMQYDSINDGFRFVAKQQGQGENVAISENGSNFLTAADISVNEAGLDAQAIIDGVSVTRSSNSFMVAGVTYTVSRVTTDGITDRKSTVSVNQDVDAVFNKIKSFVDDYNKMLDIINSELSEESYRDFKPLTDEQKAEMKDEDIKAWEEKAKSGLLRNDSILDNIASKMRATLYSGISEVSGTLYSIGIKTGTWEQKGKLIIDESKLKDAIRNTPDIVTNVFSKESATAYSPNMTDVERQTRFDESGIIARLSDVIEDNIRTTRDSDNRKGILLEKAGITGDTTNTTSIMYSQIHDKDLLIDSLLVKLTAKENNYYKQFTAMETAINRMNAQSAWLSQQSG